MSRAWQRFAMTVVLVCGCAAARAQMVDPTTGMMVDPSTDPMDYAKSFLVSPKIVVRHFHPHPVISTEVDGIIVHAVERSACAPANVTSQPHC